MQNLRVVTAKTKLAKSTARYGSPINRWKFVI